MQSSREAVWGGFAAWTTLPCRLWTDGAAAPGCDLWATKGTSPQRGCVTHGCLLSSPTAHPKSRLNHGRALPEDGGHTPQQHRSQNPLAHA